MAVDDVARTILAQPGLEGISLLGGEPFAQATALARLARAVRSEGLSVMVYTGFMPEELDAMVREGRPGVKELLAASDLVKAGRYVREQPESRRRWIGSQNQQILFLTDRYSPTDPRFHAANTVELRLKDGVLTVVGWPGAARELPPFRRPPKRDETAQAKVTVGRPRLPDLRIAARRMRAEGASVKEIERALGVARSTVSLWVRDVPLAEDVRRALARRPTEAAASKARGPWRPRCACGETRSEMFYASSKRGRCRLCHQAAVQRYKLEKRTAAGLPPPTPRSRGPSPARRQPTEDVRRQRSLALAAVPQPPAGSAAQEVEWILRTTGGVVDRSAALRLVRLMLSRDMVPVTFETAGLCSSIVDLTAAPPTAGRRRQIDAIGEALARGDDGVDPAIRRSVAELAYAAGRSRSALEAENLAVRVLVMLRRHDLVLLERARVRYCRQAGATFRRHATAPRTGRDVWIGRRAFRGPRRGATRR